MIGNDVVDFQAAATESNWRRPGYLKKVFTASEQNNIRMHAKPDLCVWLLWSMKESAYKAVFRSERVRRFNPLAFDCDFSEGAEMWIGQVRYKELVFYTNSVANDQYIHTICVTEQYLLAHLHTVVSDDLSILEALNYTKDASGVPYFKTNKGMSAKYLSISHHGRFCSYISTAMRKQSGT